MASKSEEYESRLFIDNQFIHATSGKTLTVKNPVNGSIVGTVEAAGPEDVDAAVDTATAAFKEEWATFTGHQRKNCIAKLADIIEKRILELARAETASVGLPIMFAQHLIYPGSLNMLRANSGSADKIEGQSYTDQEDGFYKVAWKRVVDVVCMQAAEHHLISGPTTPLKLFSPAFVGSMTSEQLQEIAGEDPSQKRRRKQLQKEIENLEKGKKILT